MEPLALRKKDIVIMAVVVMFASLVSVFAGEWSIDKYSARQEYVNANVPPQGSIDSTCNTLAVTVNGVIVSSLSDVPISQTVNTNDGKGTLVTPNYSLASYITYYLDNAKISPNIKAIVLDINSSGGSAQAGQEIADYVRKIDKPIIAVIHSVGESSAYLIASAADRIFASRASAVGSIGVTSSFINQAEKNKKEGFAYEQLSSGPYKDSFSPDKPLSENERKLIMRDVNLLHKQFVELVAQYRQQSIENISALADGSSLLGDQALEVGLIDEIGSLPEAQAYIEKQLGEPVSLCWQ